MKARINRALVADQIILVDAKRASIASCPFCGSYDTRPAVHLLSQTMHHVICGNVACQATGPGRYDIDAARGAWDWREPSR